MLGPVTTSKALSRSLAQAEARTTNRQSRDLRLESALDRLRHLGKYAAADDTTAKLDGDSVENVSHLAFDRLGNCLCRHVSQSAQKRPNHKPFQFRKLWFEPI